MGREGGRGEGGREGGGEGGGGEGVEEGGGVTVVTLKSMLSLSLDCPSKYLLTYYESVECVGLTKVLNLSTKYNSVKGKLLLSRTHILLPGFSLTWLVWAFLFCFFWLFGAVGLLG